MPEGNVLQFSPSDRNKSPEIRKINWANPDEYDERGEIERTARAFASSEAGYPKMLSKLNSAIAQGRIE